MMLANYVKPKPWYFMFIPMLNKYVANSLYPFIFMPKDIYINLRSSNPNLHHIALLIHEEAHRKRQKQMGWLPFGVKYLLDPKFRFNEELLNSGWLCLYPVSKYSTEKELKKVWSKAQIAPC